MNDLRKTYDISRCEIEASPEGYFYLVFKGVKVRKLTIYEYWEYRDIVIRCYRGSSFIPKFEEVGRC